MDTYAPPQPGAPRTIQTVFTPGDAARELELAALDEVIAARKADPKVYTPQENPFRIEYAVYNMSDKEVIARLIEAAKANVRVQVLIDAGQIGPHKPFNRVVETLVAAGFSHAESQLGLSQEERETKDIVEIDLPGQALFHFKARYYRSIDPSTGAVRERLLTGSHNPQVAAHKNDESLHRIDDPRIVKRYVDAFRALRDGQPIQNVWEGEQPVNVLFSSAQTRGPKPIDKIFELIEQEQELVVLGVFALRNLEATDRRRLVDRLAAARQRDVPVLVLTDVKQTDGYDPNRQPGQPSYSVSDPIDELLEAAGITVYEFTNQSGPHNAMHLKSAVFGLSEMKVVTDTGNWTQATMGSGGNSRGKNAESLLFVDSKRHDDNKTGMTYLAEYLRVMRRYGHQSFGGPKPAVEDTIAQLQSLPAWPHVSVDLKALGEAHEGREVYVVTPLPEPGGAHPVPPQPTTQPAPPPATTQTATQPAGAGGAVVRRLQSDPGTAVFDTAPPLSLPLGLRFEYRVVSRRPDGTLEPLDDAPQIVVVDPPVGTDPRRVAIEVAPP